MRDLQPFGLMYSVRLLEGLTPAPTDLQKQAVMHFVCYVPLTECLLGAMKPPSNLYVIGAAGAVAVTVPTCWYLLSNGPDTSHGHGGHDDGHGESQEESEPEQESKDEAEDKSEEKAEESADDKESDKSEDSDDEKAADTPDTSDDEGESKDGNTVKRIPDAKGGFKKRLESENAITQGEGPTKGGEGEPTDKVISFNTF